MLYVTGDTHGDFRRFKNSIFSEQNNMTKKDYVVILGDFGGIWNNSKEEQYWLDWLDNKNFTTLFVAGNHSNYDILNSFPIDEWNGGEVNFIRPSIIHLRRGQVYNFDDRKFFAFGGAQSHDISDGILDKTDKDYKLKKKQLDRNSKSLYRINHVSWWKEELPTEEEMAIGISNLSIHNNEVDYIFSHCCSTNTQNKMSNNDTFFKPDILTDYFSDIESIVKYNKWFFGHYHINHNVDNKHIALYEQIIRIY